MTTTPFLGLNTYDTASGSSTSFLTFRLALADQVSNTSKIDDFASSTSASIANIKANTWSTVNANYISSNYYSATVANITNYYAGMFVNMTFDTENDGFVTIDINGLGIVYLKKVDLDGNILDFLFNELTPHRNYMFTFDGTQFILIGSTTIDQVTAGGGGIGNFINISASNVLQDSGVPYLDGVTTGSANLIILDEFGRATSASYVSIPLTATGVANRALYSYDATNGSFANIPIPITATAVSGRVINSYDSTTGSFTNISVLSSIAGSAVMTTTTGSVVKHDTSGVVSGSYNQVFVDSYGHVTSACIVRLPISSASVSGYFLNGYNSVTGSFTSGSTSGVGSSYSADNPIIISGSVISHDVSGVSSGTFVSANVTVNRLGHITSIENGISASSVGAPVDSPFVTTGSSSSLTNYKVITAGSNVAFDSSGSTLIINSTGGSSVGTIPPALNIYLSNNFI